MQIKINKKQILYVGIAEFKIMTVVSYSFEKVPCLNMYEVETYLEYGANQNFC